METLTETIWFSEKRKELMFLLLEGAKTSEEIENIMGVSWRSMMLPVKELKEMDLLLHEDTKYKLSSIGRLVAENAKPVSDIMDIMDKNTDYWASRDLKAIPRRLCRRPDASFGNPGSCPPTSPQPWLRFGRCCGRGTWKLVSGPSGLGCWRQVISGWTWSRPGPSCRKGPTVPPGDPRMLPSRWWNSRTSPVPTAGRPRKC